MRIAAPYDLAAEGSSPMPVLRKTFFQTRKLNVLFACSSVALLLSLVWLVKVDYARPWRSFQDQFVELQRALAHFDAITAETLGREGVHATGDIPSQELPGKFPRSIINAPLSDFVAPKDTPGRHEVKQVILSDVRTDLHFVQGRQIDRCMTCHVAIADPAFTKQRLAKRLERAIVAINDALRRQGRQALSLPTVAERDDLGAGTIAMSWSSLKEAQQESFFNALVDQINVYQDMRGKGRLTIGQPLLAHPKIELFASAESAHPVSKMGCTVCHEGNGAETDFVLAAHTPTSSEQRKIWADRYCTRTAGLVPQQSWHTAEQSWDQPMLLPKYAEAGCAKCHSLVADTARYDYQPVAKRINEGRFLFTTLGCANCHRVAELAGSRRVGPDLRHVSQKLDRDFMQRWIDAPKSYRPSTPMPHYFQQENNDAWSQTGGGDTDPVLRTKAEVVALTAYLRAVDDDYEKSALPPELWKPLADEHSEATAAAADRGRRWFGSVGCLACHAALTYGPDDEEGIEGESVGTRWIVEDLIRAELSEKGKDLDELSQEEYDGIIDRTYQRHDAMSYVDRVAYAMTHFKSAADTMFDPARLGLRRDGDNLNGIETPVFTRLAAELSRLRMKLGTYEQAVAWLYDWLRDPRHYAGYSNMPRMRLGQRVITALDRHTGNTTGEMIEADEALDIAVYLSTLSEKDGIPEPLDRDDSDREALMAKRDELLQLMFRNGSSVKSVPARVDDLDRVMTKQLIAKLGQSSLGETEVRSRLDAMDQESRQWVLLGEKMIGHYGCYGCHLIRGFEDTPRLGPELTTWSEKQLSQLDFGFFAPPYKDQRADDPAFKYLYSSGSGESGARASLIRWAWGDNPPIHVKYSHASFAWHKIRNPRLWDRCRDKAPYGKLKMPNLFVASEQADSLVTFLLSRKPARVSEAVQVNYQETPTGKIARGRNLARELNCVACHRIDGNDATLHQYFQIDEGGEWVFDEANAPPRLWGEGCRVQSDWLYGFFRNVTMIRPWLNVRMPSFYLNDEQAAALSAYFAGLSQHESRWLDKQLLPVKRHVAQASGRKGVASRVSPSNHDWYRQPSLHRQADALRDFAVANRLLPARAADPTQASPEEFAATHTRILKEAGFFRRLNDVTYPFAKTLSEAVSADDLADGEVLFHELGCLRCHVFGDPAVAGANAKPTAPNFQNVHKRLRRRWVDKWLASPIRIKPGVAMPNLFGREGSGAFAEVSPEEAARIAGLLRDRDTQLPGRQTILEDGAQQRAAVAAFLYNAGERKLDVVQDVAFQAKNRMPVVDSTTTDDPR